MTLSMYVGLIVALSLVSYLGSKRIRKLEDDRKRIDQDIMKLQADMAALRFSIQPDAVHIATGVEAAHRRSHE